LQPTRTLFPQGVQVYFNGGSTYWRLNFYAPQGAPLIPGTYENAERWPFQSPVRPGLDVSGSGRGCNRLSGRFAILEIAYGSSGDIVRFAADFEQHCEGNTAALRGTVRYVKP
jgi:hypothetical protein